MKQLLLITILISTFTLAGCTQTTNDAANVIETYLAALASEDSIQAVNLSCVTWEENALAESAAFTGVEVQLIGPNCSLVEETDATAVVVCKGSYQFTYAGGEQQELSLTNRNYLLIQEDNEWKMCGYQ